MPRLIRRLAAFLEADAAGKIRYRQRKRKPLERGKTKPLPIDSNPILARGRTQSFLLDTNPIIDKKAYYIPKEPPPVLPSQKRTKELVNGRRLMNTVEIETMASPYGERGYSTSARMLSSPLRMCILTKAILPKDLLIRFGGAQDANTGKRYLLPNGIEHPKYVKTVGGTNFWVSCRKEVVKHSIASKKHAMLIPHLEAHIRLVEYTEHLLQQRLVQELTLLRDRLRSTSHRLASVDEAVVTRISRHEWSRIISDNEAVLSGMVSILHLPHPNDGPKSANDTLDSDSLPFCRLVEDSSAAIPRRSVPVYNLATHLPANSEHRIRQVLEDLLEIEASARRKLDSPQTTALDEVDAEPNVYVLRSTSVTLPRADVVPVCIALWRLRLWAGHGWGDSLWGEWESKN